METSGIILHRDRAAQIKDFSGLRFERGITPSDIDGAVEFDGRLFIFIELKLEGAPMPTGQRIMYERITDAIASSGTNAYTLIATHNFPCHSDIDVSNATVIAYRFNGRWVNTSKGKSVRFAIDEMKKRHLIDNPF